MADEHDQWLDREAAERLLRGEPLRAVADDDARRAGRLLAAFDALTALETGPDGELPGEDAALKAFREARAVGAVEDAARADGAAPAGRPVHIGGGRFGAGRRAVAAGAPAPAGPGRDGREARPRWGRPVRLAVAGALAACMVGGVAVAAGTGVLPTPFGGRDDPSPAATVSGVASPDRRLVSPSPQDPDRAEVLPDGSATPETTRAPSTAPGGDGSHESGPTTRVPSPGAPASGKTSEGIGHRLVEACHRYRGGELGAGERQRLRGSARKNGRDADDLDRFCDRVLSPSKGSSKGSSTHGGSGKGAKHPDSSYGLGGPDGRDGGDDDDGGGAGGGAGHGAGGLGQDGGHRPIAPAPARPAAPSPATTPAHGRPHS
ncbi:hypothetical protein [Streptomyces sp. NPDC006552]|uniref:hypothetical protein n=1 Tax=Streptomyces sp. NPDC006552 TaxID=3157179 RepID=UPI0033B667C2